MYFATWNVCWVKIISYGIAGKTVYSLVDLKKFSCFYPYIMATHLRSHFIHLQYNAYSVAKLFLWMNGRTWSSHQHNESLLQNFPICTHFSRSDFNPMASIFSDSGLHLPQCISERWLYHFGTTTLPLIVQMCACSSPWISLHWAKTNTTGHYFNLWWWVDGLKTHKIYFLANNFIFYHH